MSKELSDGDTIQISLKLLSEKERHEIQQQAQVLLSSVRQKHNGARLGEQGSFEVLYKLGKFLNKEFPLDE